MMCDTIIDFERKKKAIDEYMDNKMDAIVESENNSCKNETLSIKAKDFNIDFNE